MGAVRNQTQVLSAGLKPRWPHHLLATKNAVTHTDLASGKGRRGPVKALRSYLLKGPYRLEKTDWLMVTSPKLWRVQFFEIRVAYFKFRMEPNNRRALFGTAVFLLFGLFTAGRFGRGGFFVATRSGDCSQYFLLTIGFRVKKGNGCFSGAVAINPLHAQADGGAEQRSHPKPYKRFFCRIQHNIKAGQR